jgi:hypothetical protein
MRIRSRVARIFVVVGFLVLALSGPAGAAPDSDDGKWHYTVAPYVWLPTLNATINLPGVPGAGAGGVPGTATVQIGPNTYLSNLNFALPLYVEARNGDWSIFLDVIYMNLGSVQSSVINLGSGPVNIGLNVNTNESLATLVTTLAGSKRLTRTDTATLEGFVGVQYVGVATTVNWSLTGPIGAFPQSGRFSARQDLWDGVAGVKGRLQLGHDSNWFVPYYLDIGTGAFFTWQGLVGIGYTFSWGDVVLSYRHMYIDTNGSLLQNTTLSGPMLGVAFHF